MGNWEEATESFLRDVAMHPPKVSRPSWDETFFGMLVPYARRATCLRLQTASMIVDEAHRILGMGYNGAPKGMPHCLDVGCLMENGHCVRTIHDTANALRQVTVAEARGASVFQLHRPCIRCVQLMLNYEIRYLTFWGSYRTDDSSAAIRLAQEGGITVYSLGGDDNGLALPYSIADLPRHIEG